MSPTNADRTDEKRKLSVALAVEAAGMLTDMNSTPTAVLALAEQAGLPHGTGEETSTLLKEWRAFVRAAVLYGLMVQAPNIVVVEYLRTTKAALAREGYTPQEADAFVDEAFSAYVEPLLRTQTQECPRVFFHRLMGKIPEEMEPRTVAMVSGVMAMILAAVLDKLEQYEFLTE